jgi:16S rRNA processing protein RimM
MKAAGMADIFLGRLVKAFGIRGELKLDPTADFWEDILHSKRLVLRRETDSGVEERPIALDRFRPHGRCYVVDVEGVADRNAAEELVGAELFIDGGSIDVDLPEERLPFQVLGTAVRTVEGRALGEVTAVVFSPAHDIYEVSGPAGSFMIPAVPEFVVSIDDDKKEMIIKTIPGLVDDESGRGNDETSGEEGGEEGAK